MYNPRLRANSGKQDIIGGTYFSASSTRYPLLLIAGLTQLLQVDTIENDVRNGRRSAARGCCSLETLLVLDLQLLGMHENEPTVLFQRGAVVRVLMEKQNEQARTLPL